MMIQALHPTGGAIIVWRGVMLFQAAPAGEHSC